MDDEAEFSFDVFESMEEAMEEMQTLMGKQHADRANHIDAIYSMIDALDEGQLEAFHRLVNEIASRDDGQVYAAEWAGYARGLRYTRFGVNPNPWAPTVSVDDLQGLLTNDEQENKGEEE